MDEPVVEMETSASAEADLRDETLIAEVTSSRCTKQPVRNVIQIAMFHLNQMEENRFFAAIVSKKVMTDQVQTIPHVNDVRNVQNVHHTIVVLIFQNS